MSVRNGDLHVRARGRVVENFAIDVLLGMYFIDQRIWGTLPSECTVVPQHSLLASILSSFSTISTVFSDVSVFNVQSAHSEKYGEVNNDKEKEAFSLRRVSCQIMTPPSTPATVSVRCFGQEVLIVRTQSRIVKRKCLTAASGAMEILPGVQFYIYIANLLAKAVSLPRNMRVAAETNGLPQIIHA